MKTLLDLTRSRLAVFGVIFVAILLFNIVFTCYRIDEPIWEGGHHGFVMSEYPHNALNYIRFGYLNTKLGLVTNYGNIEPTSGFSYRIDHGFITSILISFSYQLFGLHEWAGRLFPTILSVGTTIVTFFLMLSLSDGYITALIAFGFCALSPMQMYYGRLPAPHNVAVFLSLLTFYFYWLWLVKKRPCWLVSVFVTLILGAYTDWITYFVVAPILVHYLFFHKGQKDWRVAIALASSPLVLFASYVVWTYWLMGDMALKTLWTTFLLRSSSGHNLQAIPSVNQILYTYYDRAKYWLTIPILILSIGWVVRFCYSLIQKEPSDSEALIFALFLFGFSHNFVFTNRVMVHDFIMFYQLVPAFAMASASILIELVLRFLKKPVLTGGAVTVIFLMVIGQSYWVFKTEHSHPAAYTQAYYLGKSLSKEVSIAGKYIDAADLYQNLGVLRTYGVANRAFKKINSWDEFMKIRDDPTYEVIVVGNSDERQATLRKYLTEKYPRENIAGYSIFKLHRVGSNVLVNDPFIEYPHNINFGNQIEFLGFDIDKIVDRKDEQIKVWERYLNQNVELLPKYRTTFRVVNYWRKISEISTDHILITQFDTRDQELLYRLEQSYKGLDNLYPTSWWPVDQVIREEFEISVPVDYPSLNYSMWIGVENATTSLIPKSFFTTLTDDNNRVRVGQVYIQTASTDFSPQIVTAVDRSVNVDLENGISLVHFRQSQEAVYPGDLLKVTLTWHAQTAVDYNYKVFVHLVNSEGHLITQHDGEPDRGSAPTSQWEPGALIQDVHPVLLPADSPDGKYYLQVGMYMKSTLERLPILYSSETSHNNAITLGPVKVLSHD